MRQGIPRDGKRFAITPAQALLLAVATLASSALCAAKGIYVAQAATGGDTGVDCVDAHSAAWFNTTRNWGVAGGQISAGDTVHLCGTISSALAVQASGTAGHVTTILFEPGAQMSAPAFPATGAIAVYGKDYITIDGGTNGVIQNTDNGTSLGLHQNSWGVGLMYSNYVTVKNLTISNIYLHSGQDPNRYGVGICVVVGGNNITIANNTIHDAFYGISVGYPGGMLTSGYDIGGNTVTHASVSINFGDSNSGAIAQNVNIHSNNLSNASNWDLSNGAIHIALIHVFAVHAGTAVNGLSVHSNYFHGMLGTHVTAALFLESVAEPTVYNNLFYLSTNGADGTIFLKNSHGAGVYNNTEDCTLSGGRFLDIGGTASSAIVRNNITYKCPVAINEQNSNAQVSTSSNNNLYFGLGGNPFYYHGLGLTSLAQWRVECDCDSGSVTGDPKFDARHYLGLGSSASRLGSNLVTFFSTDMAGSPRPSTGPWDAGSYQGSDPASLPQSPTSLRITGTH